MQVQTQLGVVKYKYVDVALLSLKSKRTCLWLLNEQFKLLIKVFLLHLCNHTSIVVNTWTLWSKASGYLESLMSNIRHHFTDVTFRRHSGRSKYAT